MLRRRLSMLALAVMIGLFGLTACLPEEYAEKFTGAAG